MQIVHLKPYDFLGPTYGEVRGRREKKIINKDWHQSIAYKLSS